ncbi:MAG: hypothetical protein WCI73_18200, partial [Phycisphaerae bacterium]
EPLRLGTRHLISELQRRGHEVWIYTTSPRTTVWIRLWFRLHGVRIQGVVNSVRHATHLGADSDSTKRPSAFGIALHFDNSPGVGLEGERYGFAVYVIEPEAANWVSMILAAVTQRESTLTMPTEDQLP